MKKKVLLAVLLSALVLALMPGATLAQGNSDETLLANSARHYIQALIAYNDGDLGEACGQLQAAASNAKHLDSELADLLLALGKNIRKNIDVRELTSRIAIIYNSHNDGSYPMFDPGNPTAVPPGEGIQ